MEYCLALSEKWRVSKQGFPLHGSFIEDSSPIAVKYKIDDGRSSDLTLLQQAGHLHCFQSPQALQT
jgi:hypothetical protein